MNSLFTNKKNILIIILSILHATINQAEYKLTLRRFDTRATESQDISLLGKPLHVAMNNDYIYIVFESDNQKIYRYNIDNITCDCTLNLNSNINQLQIIKNDSNSQLLVTYNNRENLILYNATLTNQDAIFDSSCLFTNTLFTPFQIFNLCVNSIDLYDSETSEHTASLPINPGEITTLLKFDINGTTQPAYSSAQGNISWFNYLPKLFNDFKLPDAISSDIGKNIFASISNNRFYIHRFIFNETLQKYNFTPVSPSGEIIEHETLKFLKLMPIIFNRPTQNRLFIVTRRDTISSVYIYTDTQYNGTFKLIDILRFFNANITHLESNSETFFAIIYEQN